MQCNTLWGRRLVKTSRTMQLRENLSMHKKVISISHSKEKDFAYNSSLVKDESSAKQKESFNFVVNSNKSLEKVNTITKNQVARKARRLQL